MARINQAMQDLMRYNNAIIPQVRTRFDKSHSYATTFDSGYLIPVMWDRVLPGDEKQIRVSALARMMTPLAPVMDQANLDIWCFYLPDRLWWRHAREFYGENLDADFNPDGEYVMPHLKPSEYLNIRGLNNDTSGVGSLTDYFGLPFVSDSFFDGDNFFNPDDPIDNISELYISAAPFRAYQIIWNEWFRNSSVVPAVEVTTNDIISPAERNVIFRKRRVMKTPDYFTSALRTPQAGADVLLPLGEWAPVVTRNLSNTSSTPLLWSTYPPDIDGINAGSLFINNDIDSGETRVSSTSVDPTDSQSVYPSNLWTDLTNATAATINNIRAAVTAQHFLEISAIGGKRYQQLLQAHWGVFTADATLQRPELLGSSRTTVGMRQVLQTAGGAGEVGNTGAVSVTSMDNEWICNKSFTEPGIILCLAAVRPVESYSQGIDPLFTKINLFDHYFPVFDRLGNQPIYNYELYIDGDSAEEWKGRDFTDVFGYKEAYIEYKTKQNRVTGLMRPNLDSSIGKVYTYSSNFNSPPVLNEEFVSVDPELIDRTIKAQNEPQFLLDCYFEYYDTKSMSAHSTPGLLRL